MVISFFGDRFVINDVLYKNKHEYIFLNTIYYIMDDGNYNLNTAHPIIPNSQNYVAYTKFVSIHSEDRDIIKFPNAALFEIELPEDLLNVSTVKLSSWTFPSNYATFSKLGNNIFMSMKIDVPYNPSLHSATPSPLLVQIYNCLSESIDIPYVINIEQGFFNPIQITTELTNKFNSSLTLRIYTYLFERGETALLAEFNANGGYSNFIIVYNQVSQKIWFGNTADSFTLLNGTFNNQPEMTPNCNNNGKVPEYANWGLPFNLGFNKFDISSDSSSIITPRFFYGDVFAGDNGFWLPLNTYPGCSVSWIEAVHKINIMGAGYIYMEIDGLNCIDETSPFMNNEFTRHTNQTNGICNSAFAKIPVPSTPLSQWFDRNSAVYKLFTPVAERIRRLKIKIRYHNGQLLDFGVFEYSFLLEFLLIDPVMNRRASVSKNGLIRHI